MIGSRRDRRRAGHHYKREQASRDDKSPKARRTQGNAANLKERRKRARLPLQAQTPRRRAQNARQSRRASTTTTTASRADRAEQTEPSRRRPSRRPRADRRRRRRRPRRAIIPLHAASREAAQDIRRADRAADRERLQAEQDGNADRDRRRRWEAGNGQPPGFSFNIKLSRRDDPDGNGQPDIL